MTGHEQNIASSKRQSRPGRFVRALIGVILGYAGVSLLFRVVGSSLPDPVSPDAIVALGVACIYLLMGMFVLLGTLLPNAGAKLLNVADAEELRDERTMLVMSAISSILLGASLLVLALAGTGGALLSPTTALGITGGAVLLSIAAYCWGGRGQDEYRRLVNAETSQVALVLNLILFGSWAVLAQLGYAVMFTPLAFLSGMLGLVLLAAFWIIFRRGMIVQD